MEILEEEVSAKVSVVVGEGSSVTDFNITNVGYGYEINNVLTVSVGGTDGIPYMYHGRFADAGNLLANNRQFLIKEVLLDMQLLHIPLYFLTQIMMKLSAKETQVSLLMH